MTPTMLELMTIKALYENPKIGPLLRQIDSGMEDLKTYREILQYFDSAADDGFEYGLDPDFGNCPEID